MADPKKSRTDIFQMNLKSRADRAAANKWLADNHSLPVQLERLPQEAAAARARAATKSGSGADILLTKAARMEVAAEQLKKTRRTAPITLQSIAQDNAALIERGAYDVDEGGTRVPGAQPGGTLGGTGFYVQHQIVGPSREHALHAAHVQSTLSGGYKPATEMAGYQALRDAHERGGHISVTPRLSKASGLPEGVHEFKNLTGDQVMRLTSLQGDEQTHLEGVSQGINWSPLRAVARNVKEAQNLLRAGGLRDARNSPKFSAYALSKVHAGEASPEMQNEYMDRSSYLRDVIRKDIPKGQGMLDLWGERENNTGLLSPTAPTAQDTWMEAAAVGRGIPAAKGVADLSIPPKGDIGKGDAEVPAIAARHAVLDLGTQATGGLLKKRFQLPFEVPSALVQETVWDSMRGGSPQNVNSVNATANDALNDYQKSQENEAKAARKAERESARTRAKVKKKPLF